MHYYISAEVQSSQNRTETKVSRNLTALTGGISLGLFTFLKPFVLARPTYWQNEIIIDKQVIFRE